MAKAWAKQFYKSDAWQACRNGFIQERVRIDGGVCQACRENLGYIVHHKIPLTPQNIHDPEIALSWGNLSYECKQCHDQHEGHGVGTKSEPVCDFDSDGNPVGIRPQFEKHRI